MYRSTVFKEAIAAAAKEPEHAPQQLAQPARMDPHEILEFPGSTTGPWRRYIDHATISPRPPGDGTPTASPSGRGSELSSGEGPSAPALERTKHPHPGPLPEGEGVRIATVRYPRIVPKDEECAKQLKKRTLTNLYNERPTWLALAHQKLDAAVFTAYNWNPAMTDDDLLAALLLLNLERGAC